MYLKSLTLRGFKSFADTTTVELEPGVTVVVGPNGSGKSNVVDAVAWALGAQGPRIVRSAKMDDVIFAGSASRPPLGRAEVSLTIDNSARRLPVDLNEVTITRTLFRTGESEYALNGASCRLLDIQEMLSDAGVGRQQHVIVSQGQLASLLDARPEERRAIIEEAAGILKYRRRRERAERRLEATEGNLLRLQDLQREVRRQLRPLERQAEAARRHGALADELRALRLFLAGRELASLKSRLSEQDAGRLELETDEKGLAAKLGEADRLIAASETALGGQDERTDVSAQLSLAERLRERCRGVSNLVSERLRRIDASLEAAVESDVVASLDSESARIEEELRATLEALQALVPERRRLESEEARLAAELGAEGSARGLSDEAASATAERRRARDAALSSLSEQRSVLARASERAAALGRQLEELREGAEHLAGEDEGESAAIEELRRAHRLGEAAEREAAEAVSSAESAARQAVSRAEGLFGRAEALAEAIDAAGARAGLAELAGRPGVLGTLLDLVEVEEGFERAFEAGAEEALEAVVVAGSEESAAALRHLAERGVRGAVLPAATPAERNEAQRRPLLPAGAERLGTRLRPRDPEASLLLDRLVGDVVVAGGGIEEALALLPALAPGSVVVTRGGDRLSERGWRLGSASVGATRALVEKVRAEAEGAASAAEATRRQAEGARERWAAARRRLSEVSSRLAAAEERRVSRLEHLSERRRRAEEVSNEAAAAERQREDAAARRDHLEVELAGCESLLAEAEEAESAVLAATRGIDEARRGLDERSKQLAAARSGLAVRSAALGERRELLEARQAEIERRLAAKESERLRAAERRRALEADRLVLGRLAGAAGDVSNEVEEAAVLLLTLREEERRQAAERTARLSSLRRERAAHEQELSACRERMQRIDLARAELKVRLETSLETLRHDLDCEPDEALAAVCPALAAGTTPAARVRELERELRLLGPVNPLALEELTALTERDGFLSEQLEDVRKTRRELGRIIKAIDEEIVAVFAEAFSDVAGHFEHLFATLFPGGSGRLDLVNPEDLLASGVEIEARPAGRSLRRLSLLSGGERSLVALAFLFAVFRSRPSPFYLMDEVEAALDDVNLHRFIDLLEEFRGDAQLVVVSHQKRTMESADVIYGVSMQPGGSSKVVSERLRAPEGATA